MRIAMGWRPAIWRRFMAFPDTSRMQCLPWTTQITTLLLSPSFTSLSHLHSPFQPLLLPTVYWFHIGDCCTVQLLWIYAPGSPLPWPLWRKRSGNLGRPPRSLDVVVLCLRYNRPFMTGCGCGYCYFRDQHSRGTQEPNLSGNSEMRSSLTRSFIGPRTMTGLV